MMNVKTELRTQCTVCAAVDALRLTLSFPCREEDLIPDYQVVITVKVTITQSRVDFKKLKTHSHTHTLV